MRKMMILIGVSTLVACTSTQKTNTDTTAATTIQTTPSDTAESQIQKPVEAAK